MSTARLVVLGSALLCATPSSAQSVKLNDPLARTALGGVLSFDVTPVGARAVFVADLSATDGVLHLFSAAADGSAPARLLSAGLDVAGGSLALAPADASVLFVAGGALYRAPLDGSAAPLALALPSGASAVGAPLVLSGLRGVVYRALDSSREELARADLGGRGPAAVLTALLPEGSTFERVLAGSPTGELVYVADQEAAGTFELFGLREPGAPRARRR